MTDQTAIDALKAFGQHYDYDVSYLVHMAEAAPEAFAKFWPVNALSQHRGAAPAEALFAAKLTGSLAEDCGPCVQLGVSFAREAGVAAKEIEAVLTRNIKAMSEETALGFRFADALIRRDVLLDEAREAVRARWGEAAVIELALGVQTARMFPSLKVALGYGKTCERVTVDGRPIDVVKEAA